MSVAKDVSVARELIIEKPLSIGDIVGRSFRIFRQHFVESAKILFLPTIFLALGRIALLVGSTYGAKDINHFNGQTAAWFGLAFVGFVTLFGALMAFWIRQMGLVRYFLGYSPSYPEGRAAVSDRIYAVITLTIISVVAVCLAGIVSVVLMAISIPGLKVQGIMPVLSSLGLSIGIVSFILSIVFISLVTQLTIMALALEKGELGALICKAASLTGHAFLRSIAFCIVATTAIMLISYTLTLPASMLAVGYVLISGAIAGQPETVVPIWLQIVNAGYESLVNMAVGPIAYLCYGLFYTDLCMRQEGLDLIDRLDKLEKNGAQLHEPERRHLYGI